MYRQVNGFTMLSRSVSPQWKCYVTEALYLSLSIRHRQYDVDVPSREKGGQVMGRVMLVIGEVDFDRTTATEPGAANIPSSNTITSRLCSRPAAAGVAEPRLARVPPCAPRWTSLQSILGKLVHPCPIRVPVQGTIPCSNPPIPFLHILPGCPLLPSTALAQYW